MIRSQRRDADDRVRTLRRQLQQQRQQQQKQVQEAPRPPAGRDLPEKQEQTSHTRATGPQRDGYNADQ